MRTLSFSSGSSWTITLLQVGGFSFRLEAGQQIESGNAAMRGKVERRRGGRSQINQKARERKVNGGGVQNQLFSLLVCRHWKVGRMMACYW